MSVVSVKHITEYCLNQLTNSIKQVSSWQVAQLIKKFPLFYGTSSFITAFTRARKLFLS